MERKRSVRRRQSQKLPFAERAKEHCRKFTAFMFSNVGIILLVVLYTIAGAFMFIAIEGDGDLERSAELARNRVSVAAKLWNISCCEANIFNKSAFIELVGQQILNHQQNIVRAAKGGMAETTKTKTNNKWTFSGAFLYSLTVITTIGYGNLIPRTKWGKICTIVYAIIGMPLFLLYLSNIGDILAKSFKWIYAKVCLCRICPGVTRRRAARERRKARALTAERDNLPEGYFIEGGDLETLSNSSVDAHESSEEEENAGDTETVIVPLTICVIIMIGYILFGATLFGHWEDWDPLEGSYFCFISLSSIGFGDMVPGFKITGFEGTGVELSFILCAIYLLLGMALIAMCFNLMQEQVMHKMRTFRRCIRRCFHCDR
ncbi:potassium channel subfamily K member 4-like isoform X1 [Phlebotomus argentipes]|uniref:potassium channel subfamily K member 4-like isoform X1 n=1 Tax=Phlebotomus argentipes TaxID=94469 RepID=UPI0028937106|nr:potassium channel subfamily K member 4-like isoform X1 [Phlebotomus argentipes]XP_059620710.1 potassium channel subfamily K member 4-like isoform X1 [Phlebotomus argentipes]XP_059620711.1 potassium channel subfamily K member 4-like isoform X1 [Phlebotomus argentipes]